MSALAAVCGEGRGHADAVRRMLDAAAHRARRPSRVHDAGSAALGLRAHRADAPDLVIGPRTRHAVVFDGRLDNASDLAAALGVARDAGDAALVLAAFDRWSEAAPVHLLGDFAFVIWDAAAQRLFCARDAFGQRPLFYASVAGIAVVGSEPQQVLAHPLVPEDVNEGAIAEHLAGSPTTVGETVWTHVLRVPPAHRLSISASGARLSRYWQFPDVPPVAMAPDDDYRRAFLDVLRAAVRARVGDAQRGVGVFLSGGIDSSAIAAIAARLHSEGTAPPVRAYSLAYPKAPCDETRYIDAVVERWTLPSIRLDATAPPREQIVAEIARYRDLPAFPNGSSLDPLRARAAQDVDIVLTGYGGDEWFTGSPLHAADLVREGRVVAAARQMWADAARRGGISGRAALLRHVGAPLVPRSLKPVARAIAGVRPPSFAWIRPEFAARTGLRDRLERPARPGYTRAVHREIDAIVASAQQVIGDELEERAAAAAGIEQRHPFNDRRVAEFGFALPDSQRRRGACTKWIVGSALADDLPELVRSRRDKAEFSGIFVDAIEQLGGRALFERLRIADAGWVDAQAAVERYDRLRALYTRGDAAYIAIAGPLWNIAAVELWFRHTEGVAS
jgi:asparagine synthase (glutamine-hydrolysing)